MISPFLYYARGRGYKGMEILTQSEKLRSGCPRCGAMNCWEIGIMTTNSGSTVYPYYCRECGHKTTCYARKTDVAGRLLNELQPTHNRKPECCVCGAIGAELHHWAPRHLWGKEADKWPTAYLCIECHRLWHQVVTPNMGRSAAERIEK